MYYPSGPALPYEKHSAVCHPEDVNVAPVEPTGKNTSFTSRGGIGSHT